MTYYMLPKNNNIIYVNPSDSYDDLLKPYISHSLYHYYNQTRNEIDKICSNENDTSRNCFDELIKIVNQYEYIFSKVPGSNFSVSKLKTKSNNAFPVIGVGGIHSVEDAMEKLDAGADLLQLNTGFVYEGPALIKRINKAIVLRK